LGAPLAAGALLELPLLLQAIAATASSMASTPGPNLRVQLRPVELSIIASPTRYSGTPEVCDKKKVERLKICLGS
jgi:hypothetical protein